MNAFRDHSNNWAVETILDVPGISANMKLHLSTRRNSRGNFYTSASVFKHNADSMEHRLYQDFSMQVEVASFRASKKAVEEFHQNNVQYALNRLEIVKQAQAHYGVR